MSQENVTTETCRKLSHRKWRAELKKRRRKTQRQLTAQNTSTSAGPIQAVSDGSGSERGEDSAKERERQQQHDLWLERERRAQAEWEAGKLWEEKERQRKEEEERRIKEEWEEREKKEREVAEEKKKAEEEEKARKLWKSLCKILASKSPCDLLLKEATTHAKKEGARWHNPLAPLAPATLEQEVNMCPFFRKVGACRFGERCSRAHPRPESSSVLLFPGMFANFELDHSMHDEYDTDITLEYEDEDMHRNFVEFYEDVLPEFKAIGRVVQFKVCCNYEPHLRGNVYVQFAHETDAQTAMMKFNARWYGGKQLSAEFVNIDKWKNAICGLYSRRRCPKGKLCNFLHVFHNPTNEFREADQDYMFDIRRQWQRNSDRRSSHRGQPRSERHRSRSPSRRRERHWKHRSSSSPESTSRRRRSTRQRSRSKGQSARNEDSSMRRSRSQSTGRSVSQSKNSTFGDTTNTEDRSPSMNSVKVRSHSRSHKKKQKHKTHKHCRSRRSRSASRDRSRTCTRTPSVQNGDEPVTSCPENINTAVLGQ